MPGLGAGPGFVEPRSTPGFQNADDDDDDDGDGDGDGDGDDDDDGDGDGDGDDDDDDDDVQAVDDDEQQTLPPSPRWCALRKAHQRGLGDKVCCLLSLVASVNCFSEVLQ